MTGRSLTAFLFLLAIALPLGAQAPAAPTPQGENFGVNNLLGREYLETQNYFGSSLPGQDPMERIHATPSYGATVIVGMTVWFGGK